MPSAPPVLAVFVVLVAATAGAPAAAAQGKPAAIRSRVDVESAQAILAVQSLDGWLLAGGQGNPIASELVAPAGEPTRQWFYFIPARGQPVLLCHGSEAAAFDDVPGSKLEYTGYQDMKSGLRQLVKGARKVAMEYAPRSGIPSLTRIDAGTVDLVKATGVTIASSAELVQFTKALWGPEGRVAHHVAMHHLDRLVRDALGHLRAELAAGRPITELDLQRHLAAGFATRGLEGPAPVVAAGPHTADPLYAPTRKTDRAIQRGDLVLLDLSGRVAGAERPIYARLSWLAYVGEAVPERHAAAFARVVEAREAVIEFVAERALKKRAVKGFEADHKAREVLAQHGLGKHVVHRTGHSLDTSLYGDGANLDGLETHDTRSLVLDSGFTVGPGVYLKGDFGLRSVTAVHLGRAGLERTGPAQRAITAIPAGQSSEAERAR
jgi:Xaa-Pro dipeptidase